MGDSRYSSGSQLFVTLDQSTLDNCTEAPEHHMMVIFQQLK